MDPKFIPHLPFCYFQTTQNTLDYASPSASKALPQLQNPPELATLLSQMPLETGQIPLPQGGHYYQKIQKEDSTLYILEPMPLSSLGEGHLERLVGLLENDLATLYACVEQLSQETLKNPQSLYKISQTLMKQERMLSHVRQLQDPLTTPLVPLDLVAVLQRLLEDAQGIFPDKNIQFLPETDHAMVLGEVEMLRQLFLGFLANSFAVGKTFSLKLALEGKQILVTIQDDNQRLDQSVLSILKGELQGILPKPHQGTGIHLLLCQKQLAHMKAQLWGEETPQGGLCLTLVFPLASVHHSAPQAQGNAVSYQDQEGVPVDILRELSPLLQPEHFEDVSKCLAYL